MYYASKVKMQTEEMGFRVYLSDCLQMAPQGKYLQVRYADWAGLTNHDDRTGDEIALDVINNLGLRVE